MIAKLSIASLLVACLTLLPIAIAPVVPSTIGAPASESGSLKTTDLDAFAFAENSPGLLTLKYHGRPLLVYASAAHQFKPYVKELYTLRGDNVLVDAPPDHLHHHGLMYATFVNGINFWEERGQPGFQKPIGPPQTDIGLSTSGLPQASCTQVIHWVGPNDAAKPDTRAAALLVETRSLSVTVNEKAQEVALVWHADFQVGPGATNVILSGPSYDGLGLRLPPAFNLVARHQNSEGAPYPTEGKGDVTPARWSSVSHELNGHPVTVALFGLGLPAFFTMVQPFTYLAVTQGLDKAPLKYSTGERFTLEYLLAVYPDLKTPEFLNQRFSLWHP